MDYPFSFSGVWCTFLFWRDSNQKMVLLNEGVFRVSIHKLQNFVDKILGQFITY